MSVRGCSNTTGSYEYTRRVREDATDVREDEREGKHMAAEVRNIIYRLYQIGKQAGRGTSDIPTLYVSFKSVEL